MKVNIHSCHLPANFSKRKIKTKIKSPLKILSQLSLIFLTWNFLSSQCLVEAGFYNFYMNITAILELAEKELNLVGHLLTVKQPPPVSNWSAMYVKDFLKGSGIKKKELIENLSDKSKSSNWIIEKAENISMNPVAAYNIILRGATKLSQLIQNVTNHSMLAPENETIKELMAHFPEELPDKEDITRGAQGILRLVRMYNLNVEQLARGNVSGRITGAQLNAYACWEIGGQAMDFGYFSQAVDWMELALKKAVWKNDTSVKVEDIEMELQEAVGGHNVEILNSVEEGKEDNPELFEKLVEPSSHLIRKIREVAPAKGRRYQGMKRRRRENLKIKNLTPQHRESTDDLLDAFYFGLCNGNNYQTALEKSRLFCWLEHASHPFYRIAPFKSELLVRDPDIVKIYDVLSDPVMNYMKRAPPAIFRTKAYYLAQQEKNKDKDKDGSGDIRWSLSHPIIDPGNSFNRTLEQMTGFKVPVLHKNPIEFPRVSGYTFAGMHFPHIDIEPSRSRGLRWLSVFMTYITDVEEGAGGQTVFPESGISVRPEKGVAVHWFTKLSDYTPDSKTTHASCPVLWGIKKFVRLQVFDLDQFSNPTLKCPLNETQRYRIAVNGKVLKD